MKWRQRIYRKLNSENSPKRYGERSEYKIMIEILKSRGAEDPIGYFIEIIRARIKVQNNEPNLSLLYYGLWSFIGYRVFISERFR